MLHKPPVLVKKRVSNRSRPIRCLAITGMAVGILVFMMNWSHDALGRPDWISGYTLLASCIGLMLLPLRKKLLVLPLGSVAIWQQVHHYLGLFAVASFLLHAGFPIHGIHEIAMSGLFVIISASGVLGWWINRSTPRLLATAGPSVLRDDIAMRREEIANRAYAVALSSAARVESAILAEHYSSRLRKFFGTGRSLFYCLFPTGVKRRALLRDLDHLTRYLGSDGRLAQRTMIELVRDRDDLDFQWALQNRLRMWVICHVSFVWSFFLLVALHVYWVYRFHGN